MPPTEGSSTARWTGQTVHRPVKYLALVPSVRSYSFKILHNSCAIHSFRLWVIITWMSGVSLQRSRSEVHKWPYPNAHWPTGLGAYTTWCMLVSPVLFPIPTIFVVCLSPSLSQSCQSSVLSIKAEKASLASARLITWIHLHVPPWYQSGLRPIGSKYEKSENDRANQWLCFNRTVYRSHWLARSFFYFSYSLPMGRSPDWYHGGTCESMLSVWLMPG